MSENHAAHWEQADGTAILNRWARDSRRRIAIWKATLRLTLALKRGLDIYASMLALVLFSPVFAAVAILIKLEDRGPVFFKQSRVGKCGRLFGMWKFRSMVPNADQLKDEILESNQHADGVTFKMKDDPRITKVGKWIRKLSLDEFPQFYNVLRGEMSLVGPRPPVPREVASYKAAHLRRLRVKPGITCIWQVAGRSEIDFEGQVRLDLEYIHSAGFLTDLKILIKTVPAVLFGKGAY